MAHTDESMAQKIKIIGTSGHPEFAEKIAKNLKLSGTTQVKLTKFANGEISADILESVRACDVYGLGDHILPEKF